MKPDVFTFLVGGKAGEGVKKAGTSAANLFSSIKRNVFQMDDYPSLIRGGHNFSVVSTSRREITSHYMKADVVVALGARSHGMHRTDVADGGLMIYNSDAVEGVEGVGIPMTSIAAKYPDPELRVGVSGIAALCAAIGHGREDLGAFVAEEYHRDAESNVAFAHEIYDVVSERLGKRFSVEPGDRTRPMITGNEAIALGAAAAGLDVYLGYPMTPSTTIMHFLAAHDRELGVTVLHPESEIAVANMAVGAAATGARVMVGTSGGGFGLMEEAFSFAGMAEAPILCVLSSRPGPSTGVPTYTEQADLKFALCQGHGDFPRLVASPGTVGEAFRLAAEMLGLVWAFQTPGILLTEKHMSESRKTVDIDTNVATWSEPVVSKDGEYKRYADTPDGVSPLRFPPSSELIKWNSYEHDEVGITTEIGAEIARMHDKRTRKAETLKDRLRETRTVSTFGESGPLIFTYGSTTMSVMEALKAGGIEARIVQPVYLEPFPVWELAAYREERPVVVEQSATGQFAALLAEKARIDASAVVLRYDGRPFDPLELADEIATAIS